jgi:hypothetical protein
VYRSLKKKVGEYKKLTGELPGIWRIAAQSKVRSSHNIIARTVSKSYQSNNSAKCPIYQSKFCVAFVFRTVEINAIHLKIFLDNTIVSKNTSFLKYCRQLNFEWKGEEWAR